MKLETLIAECTAYDFKLMLEEKKFLQKGVIPYLLT